MTTPLKARILLADDHELVRRGLRAVLEAEPDLEVRFEASDGEEAFRLALAEDVDLAILDVSMPRLTGLQAMRRLARHRPDLRAVILSMHDDDGYRVEAREAGASAYVLKSAAARDLVAACRAVLRGATFGLPAGEPRAAALTARESEVVKLIAEGRSGREIAEQLVISPKTVERHRSNALAKLGTPDRVALVRYAIRHGLVEP